MAALTFGSVDIGGLIHGTGINIRSPVRVATTTAGTLASSFANGSTIDGVTLATGNRILIKNQVTATENGVYTVQSSGTPIRTEDFPLGLSTNGLSVWVREGTVNRGQQLAFSNAPGSDVIGVASLTVERVGGTGSTAVTPSGGSIVADGVPRFDGTTGAIQASPVSITSGGAIVGAASLTIDKATGDLTITASDQSPASANANVPNLGGASQDFAMTNLTQTFTNKTMTATTNNISARSLANSTTAVSTFAAAAPTNGQVLTATSSTTAIWVTPGVGESNTASNVNAAGVGVFKQKTGVDLEFRGLNAASNRISVALDAANNEIDIDVIEANLALNNINGTLGATKGGTGQTTYAVGDLLFASTTTALSRLADVATGNALISGGVGVAPAWGKIGLTTHVTGTLPVANGGTGATTLTAGNILRGNGTGAITATLAAPAGAIVGTTDTQTLSNKSLVDNTTFLIDDVDATKRLQFQLSGLTTATTRLITIPDASGTLVLANNAQSLTNKSIVDANNFFTNDADPTKRMQFQLASITTGQTRVITVPDTTDTLTLNQATQTLTNKTLSAATNNITARALATATTDVVVNASAAPSTGQVLTATSSTTAAWQTPVSAGEINTASNVNAGGVGVFLQKTGVNLEFRGVNAGSNRVTVTLDAANNEIDVDAVEANFALNNLGGTLAVNKGGTGTTTFPAGNILRGNGTGAITATLAAPTGAIVGTTDTQTLTNKSFVDNNTFFIDDADATKRLRFQLFDITTGATRTITVPDASGVLALTTGEQFFESKLLQDTTVAFYNNADNTKRLLFDLSPIATATTRTLTIPNATDTIALLSTAQTFTNKTLTDATNNITANSLRSATTTINIAGSAAPSIGQVLTANSSTVATWQTPVTGGESNTASNVNTAGVGVFLQKTGVNLEFRGINVGSNKITATLDAANNEIDIDAVEANFVLNNIGGTLGATKGGTGQSTYAVGDLLFASTTTALSRLADVAIGNALISGGVGVAPAWGKIGLATHVNGTLPVANGGTGATTLTAGNILRGNGTGAITATLAAPTGAIVGTTDTQTLTNKSFVDNTTFFIDDVDATKRLQLQLSGITTGTTRTLTIPDANDTITLLSATQSLSNKTISAITNNVTARALATTTTDVTVNAAAAPTIGQVLTATSTTTAAWQTPITGGETNTASNVNVGGVGVFKQKNGVDLEFRGLNAGSNRITVTLDAANNEIDIDVAEVNLGLNNLGGVLGVAKGGTGVSTHTLGNILTGNGGGVIQSTLVPPVGAIVGTTDTQTLSNKSLIDGSTFFIDNVDSSKRLQFELSPITTATTRTFTVPNASGVLVLDTNAQTLTNKTLTDATNNVTANALRSATTTVAVNAAAAPTTGQVLTATSGTAATWQTPAAPGEVNTASNVNTAGVGVFLQKTGVNLEFRGLNVGSNRITVTLDAANNEIDIDAVEANFNLNNIGGSLSVSKGGTGDTSFVAGNILQGNGTGAITSTLVAPVGALVGTTDTQTLTNKTLLTGSTRLADTTDATKQVAFVLSGISTATTRSLTVPDLTGILQLTTGTQFVSGKIMEDSTNSFYATADTTKRLFFDLSPFTTGNTRTYSFPDSSGVVVSAAATQTLTNKTLSAVTNNITARSLATTTTDVTVNGSAAPTTGQVLTATSGTTATWQTPVTGGESNTASNVNTAGVGVFKQKTGVNLEFRGVNAGSSKVTVTLDAANNEIDVDVAEANFALNNIGGTLAVNKGGTGATTHTAGGILQGNGTGAITSSLVAPAGAIVGTTDTQTLSNKSLIDGSTFFIDNVDSSKRLQFELSTIATATTRTLTVPNANGTLVLDTTAQTLTNKSFADATTFFIDETDATKRLQFELSPITTATTRTLTVPNASDTIAVLAAAQTFTNKTLTDATNNVTANALRSATTTVSVNAATAPTTGQVLTATSGTTATWQTPVAGGEANTASNVNVGGVGVFKQKTGVNLEFRGVNVGSSKLSVTLDAANNEIDIDAIEANFNLNNIGGTLPVSKGGTGATSFTAGQYLRGNGTGAFTSIAGPSSALVGVSDTQVITNKNLTDPTNAVVAVALRVAITSPVQTSNSAIPTAGQALLAVSNAEAYFLWPFGSFYSSAAADAETSTTSTVNVNKLTFNTTSLATGEYRVNYSFELTEVGTEGGVADVFFDAVQIGRVAHETPTTENFYGMYSGWARVTVASAGAKVGTIDFRCLTGGTTFIRRARMDIWRVLS